jgi:hypothetical protein
MILGFSKGAESKPEPTPHKTTRALLGMTFVCTMPNRLPVKHPYFKLSKKTQIKQNDTNTTYGMTLTSID